MIEYKKIDYNYDAFEDVIDKETMRIHHELHHKTYYNNLLNLIENTDLKDKTLEEILQTSNLSQAVINNAGGTLNHNQFFYQITPGGSKEAYGNVLKQIEKDFGSFDEFKEKFIEAGVKHFGSGFVFLVYADNKLEIMTMINQNNPILENKKVILLNDLWEHAYYLKYQNKRKDYLINFFNIINWDIIENIFNTLKTID